MEQRHPSFDTPSCCRPSREECKRRRDDSSPPTRQQRRRPFRRVVIVSVVSTEFLGKNINKKTYPHFLLCQMPSRAPPLGSLAVQSPSSQSSQLVHVSPATCHNLSLFKGS